MAVLYSVWVPAVSIAHLLGLSFFLYGLECITGVLSKTWIRLGLPPLCSWPATQFATKSSPATAISFIDANARGSNPLARPGYSGTERKEVLDTLTPCPDCHLASSTSGEQETLRSALPASCKGSCAGQKHLVHSVMKAADLCDVEAGLPGHAPMQIFDQPAPKAGASVGDVLLVKKKMRLTWSEVSCHISDQKTMRKKQVLAMCTGQVSPGEIHGLVGPSGAGKSTLLDILSTCKNTGTITGQVLVNGQVPGKCFRRESAVVDQEGAFVPTLTAMETLRFHAQLRLTSSYPAAAMQDRMDDVIKCLGLWKCRNTQVGGELPGGINVRGLSGGEKRRLMIACALIANPSIIFLDEPTTGLDSFAALNVMQHMSQLASMGHTIITTVHQPRAAIWDLLHKVTILSEGYQMYTGQPHHAVDWFNSLAYYYEPSRDGIVSDWLIDLVSVVFRKPSKFQGRSMTMVEEVRQAAERFHDGHQPEVHDSQPMACYDAHTSASQQASPYAATFCTQFRVLLSRAIMAQLRNPTDAAARLLLSCWVGCLTGLVFWDLADEPSTAYEVMSVLFYVLLVYEMLPFCYMSFYTSDRRLYYADTAAQLYSPMVYHLSSSLAGAPFIIVNTLVGAFAAYGMAGLRDDASSILLFGVVNVIQSLAAVQLLVACVFLTPNQDLAYILATGYLSGAVLLSGVWIRQQDFRVAPMRWLSYLSYTRYAISGVAHEQFARQVYPEAGFIVAGMPGASDAALRQARADPLQGIKDLSAGFLPIQISTGNEVLSYWDFSQGTAEVIGILLCFYAVFFCITYFAMALLYKHKR